MVAVVNTTLDNPSVELSKKKKKKKKQNKKEEEQKMEIEENIEEEKPVAKTDEKVSETKKKKKKKKNKKLEELEKEDTTIEIPNTEETDVGDKKKKKKKKNKRKAEELKSDNESINDNNGESSSPPPTKKMKDDESPFKKCFYEMKEITKTRDVKEYYAKHSIAVYGNGSNLLKPVCSFDEMSSLDPRCLTCCKGFKAPTPIQAMTWPVVTSGRDVIGIAETGSGKTLAFSVPALAHLIERKLNPVKGISSSPMMLVLAPTRELAMQSQEVLHSAGKHCGIRSTCLYGGVAKFEQRKALMSGVEVVVATPGRLLDLMEEGCCDLSGVSYVVLDEADRMLDQGFERAIRIILGKTHSERQTCLFSATWPDCIRELAHEFLKNPIKVTIGSEDLAAGKTVTQIVEVVEERSRDGKISGLLRKYHKNKNRILIFVLYKKEADRLFQYLQRQKWHCGTIHGNKTQEARNQAVEDFKSGNVPILIATDVAARGLDIPDVEYVLNYSFPLTIEDYVHRIGRTGRAGKSGIAHTFFHVGDKARAGELVNLLKESKQPVPEEMYKFDLSVKRKEHKLYGSFGPKSYNDDLSTKKATRIVFE